MRHAAVALRPQQSGERGTARSFPGVVKTGTKVCTHVINAVHNISTWTERRTYVICDVIKVPREQLRVTRTLATSVTQVVAMMGKK